MSTNQAKKDYIQKLKHEYDSLIQGKESLLTMIDEVEIAEAVYNSNAIENSTLTLKETEMILLEMDLSKDLSLREVYEAKNLARVVNYIRNKAKSTILDQELILLLHQMLLGGINDDIAGRLREPGEYVRVANHIAPAPEQVEELISTALKNFSNSYDDYFITRVAKFHLAFEHIHPFCDGNGRMGRVLINLQLQSFGFPPIIIRDKEKAEYYKALREYDSSQVIRNMEKIIVLGILESLHKRLAYLNSKKIVKLSDYARKQKKSTTTLYNAARRQTIPAFREKGVWKIGS